MIPNIEYEEWHSYIKKLQLWWSFRYRYDEMEGPRRAQEGMNLLNTIGKSYLQRYGEYYEIKPKTHSLYIYFRTLPKEVREREAVKTVYLGLEHGQPDYTYEEKEEALNQAAYWSMPLDEGTAHSI